MRFAIVATAILLAAAGAAPSGALGADGLAAEDLPPVVQAALAAARTTCEPDATRLEDGFLKSRDVNGDGVPDFILDYGAAACPDGSRIMCGSGGCLMQVFVSTRAGYVKALDENVQDLTFIRKNDRPAMRLGAGGSACGRRDDQRCSQTLSWNGSRFVRDR